MPLVPRRRHYSWPFSGPSTKALDRNTSIDRRASQLASRARNRSLAFESAVEGPFYPEDVYEEDDAVSAGIIPSAPSKRTRHSRLWPVSEARKRRGYNEKDVIISSVTEADELPKAVLRRIVWPRLEKVRQLLPLHNKARTSSVHGNNIVPSCFSSPNLSEKEAETMSERCGRDAELDEGHLRPLAERRHRRCHSEQPRVWKEPSPGLWTLAEE
ncbi:hypothetical protein VTN96DRAFT_6828 [Rasamsonia emersonii]|uniref:Uncharacterized protein n=1 Tax=Rasamsonia emersonii (strain ATCC 16479 / CBS 393.64 / IMI 116815) TaxID=1408163 RepID=A0A0F4YWU4_RASE3|nr:hypothetical protein T310_3303 [Rasamsonia emersonii CBS 393.64]KKA22684.1 hypothetical protein T310_3303 [Rasamsonia emersonii CBS 393.64]